MFNEIMCGGSNLEASDIDYIACNCIFLSNKHTETQDPKTVVIFAGCREIKISPGNIK